MKKIFISLLLLATINSYSQDYKLFPNQFEKLFCIPVSMDSCYDLSFDSIVADSDGTNYYNYFEIENEYFESDVCVFWGGPICQQQDKSSWIGPKITMHENHQYHFFNGYGDTLAFDFRTIPNNNHVFYQDETQSFHLEYISSVFEPVLGETDSIRVFKISHFDSDGNIINSPLHDSQIEISKTYGLKYFLKVDQFPSQLQPLNLIGITVPNSGLNHINQAMLHDHEIGDEIQYEKRSHREEGSPDENYIRYTKYVFLDKWESNDTLNYNTQRIIHYKDSIGQQIDTILLSYSHLDTLARIPFQRPNPSYLLIDKTISRQFYGEIQLLTYSLKYQYLEYCAEDNCWGDTDNNGPPPNLEIDYVVGLGLFNNSRYVSQPPPEGYSVRNKIIYFKKSDIVYGDDVILGISEDSFNNQLVVFPQPASNQICFKSPNQKIISDISIFDLSGKLVQTLQVNDQEYIWDCSGIETGVYIYQGKINGQYYRGKLVIQ